MRWQTLEDNTLRRTYPDNGRVIAQSVLRAMGFRRSRRAIICRAHKLELNHNNWTGQEDWTLEQCYPIYGARYTQRYMPRRSRVAIRDRARRLGIQSRGRTYAELPPEHDHLKAIAWLGVKYRGE